MEITAAAAAAGAAFLSVVAGFFAAAAVLPFAVGAASAEGCTADGQSASESAALQPKSCCTPPVNSHELLWHCK